MKFGRHITVKEYLKDFLIEILIPSVGAAFVCFVILNLIINKQGEFKVTLTHELNREQFLYLRDSILNNSIIDDKQKELLNDVDSYIIVNTNKDESDHDFLYNHGHDDIDDFIDAFNSNLFNLLFCEPNDIIEYVPQVEGDHISEISFVCQIGDRYFHFTHDPHYNTIDGLEEVFPIEIKVRTFKNKNNFITNDHLDIVSE